MDDRRRTEERYQLFLQNFTGIAYQVRLPDFVPTFFQGMIEAITGHPAADLQSGRLLWPDLVHPEDRDGVRSEGERLRTDTAHVIDNEYRILHRDGGVRWVRDIARQVGEAEADGGVSIQGAIYDVTRRHQAEEAQRAIERRLLHSQKLESLGLLAGGIAHDFNNLLMAIQGNVDLVLQNQTLAIVDRNRLEQALGALQRSIDLTRQMLAYSGRGQFVFRPLDLNALVHQMAELLAASVAKTTALRLDLADSLPAVRADAGQLQQVIMNLLLNASEALGGRAGIVRLSTGVEEADEARLADSRQAKKPAPGPFVFLEVADDGCGMDEDTQQRLFDPFFTTKFTGRGLGTSAVLGIVGGHGGAIFVDSAVGRGTVIRVLLPVQPGTALPRPDPTPAPPHPPRTMPRGTALVVDDEEMVRTVAAQMLATLGLRVLTAGSGSEALELFEREGSAIDLVLLDLTMPDQEGTDLFDELRRRRPATRVILCSGFDRSDALGRFERQTPDDFLQKPFTLRQLREVVTEILGGRG